MNTRIGFLFDALLWVAYLSAEQNQINDLTTYRPISVSGHSGEWSSKRSTGFEFKRKTWSPKTNSPYVCAFCGIIIAGSYIDWT